MEVLEDEPLDVEVGVVGGVLQLLQTLLSQLLQEHDYLFTHLFISNICFILLCLLLSCLFTFVNILFTYLQEEVLQLSRGLTAYE